MAPQLQNAESSLSLSSYSSEDESVVEQAVVIVTPYSTGCCVARDIQRMGYTIIRIWNHGFSDNMKQHVPKSCAGLTYHATVNEQETLEMTIDALKEAAEHREIVAVVCGGEAGVDLTDAISEKMGLLSNGTDIQNRRDKKVQQELIKEAGLRSCRQAAGTEFSQVEEFLLNESYPVIVKPVDSAGSDGVKLCETFDEARAHFNYLRNEHSCVNVNADEVEGNFEILCQEFLKGKEYVVDHVSLDGIHKTMMIWVYDKRAVNGGNFVYFGDVPVDSESPEAKLLIPYARAVLDVLGCKHGPSHGEFIMTDDGPCLVEMNCRCHGGDGIWQQLCRGLTGGYDQVDCTIMAYFNQDKFMELPDKPASPFVIGGQCVDLVSYKRGVVRDTPGYDRIKSLSSFVCLESGIHRGSYVQPTVDMATDVGSVVVMNKDRNVLEQDIATIRALETANAMFTFEEDELPSNLLERKFSIPRDPNPVFLHDVMEPSMYLERKLSIPKSADDAMYIKK